MNYNQLAYYYNLPPLWGKQTLGNFTLSKERYNKIIEATNKYINESDILYIQNLCSLVVQNYVEKGVKVFGVDFKKYFDDSTTTKEFSLPIDKDIYIVYNVGLEKALNTSFSSRLLQGLINDVLNLGKTVLLCSNLPYNQFYKMYEIDIPKHLNIGLKKSEQGLI